MQDICDMGNKIEQMLDLRFVKFVCYSGWSSYMFYCTLLFYTILYN